MPYTVHSMCGVGLIAPLLLAFMIFFPELWYSYYFCSVALFYDLLFSLLTFSG